MELTTGLSPSRKIGSFELNAALVAFLLLLAADTGFVLVHVVHRLWAALRDPLYSLGQDGGYAEMFQYLKFYWVAILLGTLRARTREPVYGAWMLLYAYLLCDDALRLHELGGARLVAAWGYGPAFGLRAQDFGELTVSAAAGLVFLALICAGHLRSAHRARDVSTDLALLLGALVFFGVFMDMLHIAAQGRYLKEALGVIEDGGELFTMSVVCWYVFSLFERSGSAPVVLWRTSLGLLSALRAGRG
jgi:hypothetical protein